MSSHRTAEDVMEPEDDLPAAVAAYLEVIFELDEDEIESVQVRIAERLGVSRPAVSEMVRKLRSRGMVQVERGRVVLTALGQEHAERRVRRHRLAERFLTDVLSLGWAEAHTEAEAWERVMNARTEAAMARVLGSPTTCPHGNPIPGSGYTDPLAQPLAELLPGARFAVVRITEQLEFIPGMLDALEQAGLLPGANGQLLSSSPDGSLAIELDPSRDGGTSHLAVAGSTAERILVSVEGTSR
jgi:DtxR family Mn-dependent transcriptional regulator